MASDPRRCNSTPTTRRLKKPVTVRQKVRPGRWAHLAHQFILNTRAIQACTLCCSVILIKLLIWYLSFYDLVTLTYSVPRRTAIQGVPRFLPFEFHFSTDLLQNLARIRKTHMLSIKFGRVSPGWILNFWNLHFSFVRIVHHCTYFQSKISNDIDIYM